MKTKFTTNLKDSTRNTLNKIAKEINATYLNEAIDYLAMKWEEDNDKQSFRRTKSK